MKVLFGILFFLLRTFLLFIITCAFCKSSSAQRISFNQFCTLYGYTLDNLDFYASIKPITNSLKANGVNWATPEKDKDSFEERVTWPYKVSGNLMGYFQISQFFTEGKRVPVRKATFIFPYKVQYNDYLAAISNSTNFVNTFTQGGAIYRIYESQSHTFALITVPSSESDFYMNGKPAEHYIVEIHNKL